MPRAKKDISKDLMFQKIMPSADEPERTNDGIDAVDNISDAELSQELPKADVTDIQLPFSSNEPLSPAAARYIASNPIASSMKNTHQPYGAAGQIAARTISFSHDSEGSLVNIMEHCVIDNLEKVLSRFKCCKCDRCKKDIVACALNSLPPHYIVLTKESPTPKITDRQAITEITTAMVRAVIKVKSSPRH